jgi:ribonuclease VapC
VNKIVVDASVLLAVIHEEPGSEHLTAELLANAIVSTVNLAEVQSKLLVRGWTPEEAWVDATGTVGTTEDFTAAQAKTAGSLIAHTRPFGLSVGERACLALALELKAPVYTADRSWNKLKIGVRIHVIR